MTTKAFFDQFFNGCTGQVHLWIIHPDGKKRSYWFAPEECPDEVDQEASVYFGTCTRVKALGPHRRGKVSEILCVPGVWAEIDYAESAAEKKSDKNYPPEVEANQIVDSLPVAPSCIVHSGGGLHLYWLLKHPLIITDEQSRAGAAGLVADWWSMVAVVAGSRGYDIDSVQDITRVLRVPGSMNHKYGGRRIELLPEYRSPDGWIRYSRDELEEHLVEDDEKKETCGGTTKTQLRPRRRTVGVSEMEAAEKFRESELNLGCNQSPSPNRIDTLVVNCPEFGLLWRRKSKRIKSQSECDFGMAIHAFEAGWSEQDVIGIITQHRIKHSQNPQKALRPDYMWRTLSKAKRIVAERQETAEAESAVVAGENLDACKKLIKLRLGLDIESIVKHGQSKPSFVVSVAGERPITLDENELFSACVFRRRVMVLLLKEVNTVKASKWPAVCNALIQITVPAQETASEDTDYTLNRVKSYVGEFGEDAKDVAAAKGHPFVHDAQLHIQLAHFADHLRQPHSGTRDMLREAGFANVQVRFTDNSTPRRAYFYRIALTDLPAGWDSALLIHEGT